VTQRVLAEVWGIADSVLAILFGKRRVQDTNRWQKARQAIQEGWKKTRRSASEGVEAIRQANLVAGSVGPPGLMVFQYMLDRLTPLTLAGPMEQAFLDACANIKDDQKIRKLTPRRFEVGTEPPRLQQARLYDVGGQDLAFDVLVRWNSQLLADVDVTTKTLRAKIPVSVRNVRFEGPVRVIVTSLQKPAPGYGAVLISLPEPPKIALDLKVLGGELTKLPWLRVKLMKNIKESIVNEALWPRRIVLPAGRIPPRQLKIKTGSFRVAT
jgi:hypothetical protein